VDHALCSVDQPGGEVVELPGDAHELPQIDLVTRQRRHPGDPREHLASFLVDAQRARRPGDVGGLQVAQDPLHQAGVLASGASDRVADSDRTAHQNSVAHVAQPGSWTARRNRVEAADRLA
jgi:hypothetical protein